jgi:colanic acid/amylovoran biosynthesis glycosyltransferase
MRALVAKKRACELVLAGDGELREPIERLIAKFGLSSNVRITGWLSASQVREHILSARALVLPSFAEGLPVVLMEAMLLEKPVLSTFVAGIPELVIHGENGWLFPAGDIEATARAMEACLDASAAELTSMGKSGRERAVQRHDIELEAAKLAGMFRGLSNDAQNAERATAVAELT